MEQKSPEALDDIRKKRLAYFETSLKQRPSENLLKNVSELTGTDHPNKGSSVQKAEIQETEMIIQKLETIESHSQSEYRRPKTVVQNNSREKVAIAGTSELDQKPEVWNYNKEVEMKDSNSPSNKSSDTKKTPGGKTDFIEDRAKLNLKTTSFFFSAGETDKQSPESQERIAGHKEQGLDDANETAQTESVQKMKLRDKRHVHYDDGYNEMVERLIKATREEILGKQVEDNIWSKFKKPEGNDGTVSFKENLDIKRVSEPVFQEVPIYSANEPRRHSVILTNDTNQTSGSVNGLFQSDPTTLNTLNTNFSLNESHLSLNTKVDKSNDLCDLGLSTHRPGKAVQELTIETHGIKLNESLTRQLRHALGEEKFNEFLEKSKKDIDVLQQERVSARSESEKRKIEKPVKKTEDLPGKTKVLNNPINIPDEKKQTATVTEDFTPRNDGEAVQDLIGEHLLKKKQPREKLTSNPAYKQKPADVGDKLDSSKPNVPKKFVPELNLTGVNTSPRPLLNRPKHEPYNIYQENANFQTDGKIENRNAVLENPVTSSAKTVKNYEQVTVSRNVMFSADEIYYQAYGKYPESNTYQPEVTGVSYDTHMGQQGTKSMTNVQEAVAMSKGIQMNHHESGPHAVPMSPHAMGMTPHGMTPYSVSNTGMTNAMAVSPQYSFIQSNIIPVSVHSAVHQKHFNVPAPPPFINGHFSAVPDSRHFTGFIPTSAQSPVNSVGMQIPHPPLQPPPTNVKSQQFQSQPNLVFTTAASVSSTPHYGIPGTPNFPMGSFSQPQDPQWVPPSSVDQPLSQQGLPQASYPVGYSYSYPVMVMAPHPPPSPPEPAPQSEVSDKTPIEEKSTITDKVDEETTFTSVSQIKHPEEEVMVPHPPVSQKDGKKRSPRKVAMQDRTAKRHIDGIRKHHEQRRQQQDEEQMTEAQIIEKQRKFAKASIERYFQSLENLYKPTPKLNLEDISDGLSDSSEEKEAHEVKNKIKIFPEGDINENKINSNEKLDEIFKKTSPENFDLNNIKTEINIQVQDEKATSLGKNVCLEEDNNKSAQFKIYYEQDLMNKTECDFGKHKPVVEAKCDFNKPGIQSQSKHDIVCAAVDSSVNKLHLKEEVKDWDNETLVNTAVTEFTIDAGGVTERLNELGIDSKYVKNEINNNTSNETKSDEKKVEGQKVKKGKLLIICPECEGFNKEYMSWCNHCGEMIIGVEPMFVSKNRQGKIRTNPVSENVKATLNRKISTNILETESENINEEDNTQFTSEQDDKLFEKPLKLDLGLIKSDSPRGVTDTKLNISPNKSDGKDSGRPSSDDQETLQNRNRIEQEVEYDICEAITDPLVKDYVKSHFAKRRQLTLENKSMPSSEQMKSKVQSWIEEIGNSEPQTNSAQTLGKVQAAAELQGKGENQTDESVESDSNKAAQHRTTHTDSCEKLVNVTEIISTHFDSNNEGLNKIKKHAVHFDKDFDPKLGEEFSLMSPETPKFESNDDIHFDPLELNLNLVSESMDFSQIGSVDFSQIESKCVDDKAGPGGKGDAAKAKKARRKKKGHGAIDVEVFGYEESRECKNSSRGQRLVPVLNLPLGSSDEEGSDQEDITENNGIENDILSDMIVHDKDMLNDTFTDITVDTNEMKVNGFGDAFSKQQHTTQVKAVIEGAENKSLRHRSDIGKQDLVLDSESEKHASKLTAWQSLDSGPRENQEEVNEKGAAGAASGLVRPEKSTDEWQYLFDPTLAEDDQQEESPELDEEDTERDQQPFLVQLVGKKDVKRKCPKSSRGKPVKSKVRQSIEKPGYQRKWARSSTAWSSYNPGELNTSSSLRITDVQGQSSDRGQGHDQGEVNGNLSERSVSPTRPSGNKARPVSADVYKRKSQKSQPVSAGLKKSRDRSRAQKDQDDDLYELVEHRLPRMGIFEMLQDRFPSPRSTYDKYLQMTPRIHEGTLSCWQCLPDEILIHIFAYLTQADLTRCAQVCHQFYRVAMDESLWKYITIKKKSDLDDSCLEEISKRHPISLALIHCHGDQITAKGLRDMFRECAESLKELNISRCSRGALNGDSILLHAAARCHNITHVDTSWCNVTDSGLMAISNSCNRLESLCINGCQAISNDGLETIIRKHGASLRVLEMFGCFNITPRGLQAVSNNCINLVSLHLGQCYKLTDSSIAQLSSSLGRVETLDLRGCKQIKDNCIRRVVKNCTRLKNLSLANCPNITDVSILEISTYLTDIRSIDLCGCKNITDSSIRALVNTCTNLRHIDISSTSCTHRSVSMIANFSAQRLESLRINFLSDVTEASLIKLAKHCRRLTSVHLYGCPSVKNLDKIREENPTFTIEM